MQPRIALYARVSTPDQSAEMQLTELRARAAQRSPATVREFVDVGVSGAVRSRPALGALMEAVRSGQVDLLMVWRFDRVSRSTLHLVQLLDELHKAEVEFVSLQEDVDTTSPMGRVIFTLIAALAELEREAIRERVRAGMAAARAQGRHVGRPALDVELQPALLMLDEGHSLTRTATALRLSRRTLKRRLVEAGAWPRPGAGAGGSAAPDTASDATD